VLVRAATAEAAGTSETRTSPSLRAGGCHGLGDGCRIRHWCAGRPARDMLVAA